MDANRILVSIRDEDQSFHVRYRMEASCLELALEGERLCKVGDYPAGVSFFEAAIQVGTEDLQILSAIYSQLGNAYFHLHDYSKALEYHHHDLTLTRTIGDPLGEAKASGNLGNTLKVLGRFDEAIVCCQRHLEVSIKLNDKVGEARALYNFGNVYHAKGKSICWSGADPGEFPEEAMTALQKAAEYYEANLSIVKELGDRAGQGRTYGNLGNTHYLLGNFRDAVISHEQRLLIAKEFGDKSAERRAYCNLGNAYIFLEEFEIASEHYKKTLLLARQLKDRAVEAQACYSLGNTYTLLQDYERAIDYHLKHLIIAQDLNDRMGEGRACWSLGNAYTALGSHDQAMHFAEKHLEISKETGDRNGELTARMNVSDLQMVLGLSYSTNNSVLSENHKVNFDSHGARPKAGKRHSMENMELMKLTPDKVENWNSELITKQQKPLLAKSSAKLFFVNHLKGKKHKHNCFSAKVLQDTTNSIDNGAVQAQVHHKRGSPDMLGDEGFFDLLSRFQSNRMDDQRCSIDDGQSRLSVPEAVTPTPPRTMHKSHSASVVSPHTNQFLDLVASSQSRRLDDQRASVGNFPGLRLNQQNSQSVLSHLMANADNKEPDEDFFDMLVKCQGSRLDDQRCAPPTPAPKGPTVPDEDFFSLIMRSQAKRMDEQRVTLPPAPVKQGTRSPHMYRNEGTIPTWCKSTHVCCTAGTILRVPHGVHRTDPVQGTARVLYRGYSTKAKAQSCSVTSRCKDTHPVFYTALLFGLCRGFILVTCARRVSQWRINTAGALPVWSQSMQNRHLAKSCDCSFCEFCESFSKHTLGKRVSCSPLHLDRDLHHRRLKTWLCPLQMGLCQGRAEGLPRGKDPRKKPSLMSSSSSASPSPPPSPPRKRKRKSHRSKRSAEMEKLWAAVSHQGTVLAELLRQHTVPPAPPRTLGTTRL